MDNIFILLQCAVPVNRYGKIHKYAFTLAEGATHIDICDNIRKRAFTLAEVLITLSIIGVVAALTLPPLIQHHNKVVWVNQLKKSVNTLENGFKLMLADEGVDNITDTSLWSTLGNANPYFTADKTASNFCGQEFIYNLQKYFKINILAEPERKDVYALNFGSGASHRTIVGIFPDNVQLLSCGQGGIDIFRVGGIVNGGCGYGSTNQDDSVAIVFAIDVNGYKKPNKFGRDVFPIAISQAGKVINFKDAGGPFVCATQNSIGYSCAARIIEEGWKMNY